MRLYSLFQKTSVRFVVAILVIGIVLLCALLVRSYTKNENTVEDPGVELADYWGKTVPFNQFINGIVRKPLVVFFWATWCPYCRAEFGELTELKAKGGNQLNVIAVNRGESLQDAKRYTDALPATGASYLLDADDALFKKLGGYAMPETIFIDTRGEIIFHKHGPISHEEILIAAKQLGF